MVEESRGLGIRVSRVGSLEGLSKGKADEMKERRKINDFFLLPCFLLELGNIVQKDLKVTY